MIVKNPIQQIGMIPAGVKQTDNIVVCSNKSYIAYASFFTAYIFEQDTFRFNKYISSLNTTIRTICLNQKNNEYFAISFENKTVIVYNIVTQEKIAEINTPFVIDIMDWIPDGNLIVGFDEHSMIFFNPFIENPELHRLNLFLPSVHTFKNIQVKNQNIFILGCGEKSLMWVEMHSSKFEFFSGDGLLTAIDFDPFNQSNCMTAWSSGTIIVFDVTNGLEQVHKTSTDAKISAAAFISSPPGHFITASAESGVISLWTSLSADPIERIVIGDLGIKEIRRATGDNIIFTFRDGLIIVYDFAKRCSLWENYAGHSNTIFDVRFHPTNEDILLSCSAEGTICSWDIDSFQQIDRIYDQRNIFACMEVSPGGGYVVCGTTNGFIVVFSLKTLMATCKKPIFENDVVGLLSCSKLQPELILASSKGGKTILYDINNGAEIWNFNRAAEENGYCGDFSIHKENMFAIGSSNGKFYIYDNKNLKPYSSKNRSDIIQIKWSPHDDNVIITTDKEGKIIVWHVYDDSKFSSTTIPDYFGHSIRIIFHPSITWLAASSCKDGYINIFDIRSGTTLASIAGHYHHIYGLTFSEKRPFILVTSSRDTTIKMWDISNLLIETQIPKILFNKSDYSLSISIFKPLQYLTEFVNIVGRLSDDGNKMKVTPKTGEMIHVLDSVRVAGNKIKHMLSASPRETSLIKKAIKSRKRMVNAASLALLSGNPKKYCELMFAAGEYDKAVAAAPSVSVDFWQNMIKERIKLFESPSEQITYNIILRQYNDAIDLLNQENDFYGAFLLSASTKNPEKVFTKVKTHQTHKKTDEDEENAKTDNSYVDLVFNSKEKLFEYEIASKIAHNFISKYQLYRAASSFLTIGDVRNAICFLQQNGELFSAVFLANKFNLLTKKMAIILVNISEDAWNLLPSDLRKYTSPLIKNNKEKFRFDDNLVSHPTSKQMMQLLLEYQDYKEAIRVGIDFLLKELQKTIWDYNEISETLDVFEVIHTDYFTESQRKILNSLEFYIALFRCYWKGFFEIHSLLYNIGLKLANEESLSWLSNNFNYMKWLFENNTYSFKTITIAPSYYNMLPFETYTFDGKTFTRDFLLKWKNVTSFSPTGSTKRFYVL